MRVLTFHPGDTVVVNFFIPFLAADVAAVVMSIRNKDRVVFEATALSFGDEGNGKMRVGYTFTQAESLLFDEFSEYWLQLNVFSHNSSRVASNEIRVVTLAQHIYETSYGSDPELAYAWEYDADKGDSDYRAISYTQLLDKPKVNEVTLEGNRNLAENRITNEQIDTITSET